jgi:hypothetical protein
MVNGKGMSVGRYLRALLYGGSTRLSSCERLCLDVWKARLTEPATQILNRQLNAFDFVQRTAGGTVVMFHCADRRAYERWPDDQLFPRRAEELVAAIVRLEPKARAHVSETRTRSTLKATIMLHKGRLSSLEFNKRPDSILPKGLTWAAVEATVEIRADPMTPAIEGPDLSLDRLRGWVRDWLAALEAQHIRPPRPALERDRLLADVDAAIPDDYRELVSQTDGFSVGTCEIHGPAQIRPIMLPESQFLLLAERPDKGVIALQDGEPHPRLYYIDNEEHDVPVLAGASFRNALTRHLL